MLQVRAVGVSFSPNNREIERPSKKKFKGKGFKLGNMLYRPAIKKPR